MLEHSRGKAVGRWRRWTFRAWVGITIVVAAYVVSVLPFTYGERASYFLLGTPVPFVMIGLLALGLGWLIWLVTARRRRPPQA